MSPGADLDLIAEAARAAGARALEMQARLTAPDIMEKDGGEPVTAADLAADAILRERLLSARPDYGWLSEESAADPRRTTRQAAFVVDPIDGTRAFIAGEAEFMICVAVVRDGRPEAGVLYQPAGDALYAARAGGGAALNGAALSVSDREALSGGRLVCPLRNVEPARYRTPWPDDLELTYRNSMAYRLAMVARGDWHGALALSGKSDWDLAAADLILGEAGGVITGLDGAPFRYNGETTRKSGVVAGGPAFHAALMDKLNDRKED